MTKYCYGCGVLLQANDEQKAGYVSKLDLRTDLLCQRCFRMKNYHEYHSHYLTSQHFKKIVAETIKNDCLIVLVVDLFDLNASFNENIIELIKQNPVIIVGSKRDLLLKSVKDQKIKAYLKMMAQKYDLNLQDVVLASAQKKYEIDTLLASIYRFYQNKDVFIVGVTNVGKSSLLNALVNSVAQTKQQVTISNYPGTTLDSIKIHLATNVYIYDTPGLVAEAQMIHYLEVVDYKYLQTKNEIKARNYQLEPQQSLFIGGLACFNFLAGTAVGFNVFVNNNLKIHRTKYDNRAVLYDEHQADDTLIPRVTSVKQYEDFIIHRFELKEDEIKKDLVIYGLGWITFIASNQVIELALPQGVKCKLREALI